MRNSPLLRMQVKCIRGMSPKKLGENRHNYVNIAHVTAANMTSQVLAGRLQIVTSAHV